MKKNQKIIIYSLNDDFFCSFCIITFFLIFVLSYAIFVFLFSSFFRFFEICFYFCLFICCVHRFLPDRRSLRLVEFLYILWKLDVKKFILRKVGKFKLLRTIWSAQGLELSERRFRASQHKYYSIICQKVLFQG